ncbi:hypothetical protein AB7C87_20670 [Natrarchaeobius sp. A-rgal3]|uniref:hypothetical protein n=1 Tax=Natrarchaeobius versutus TaxID=1679078 RepID=UPI00350EAB19
MNGERDRSAVRRRALLSAVGSAVGVSAVGTTTARDAESGGSRRCPDATIRTDMDHCEGASMERCADDHPETIELREQASETIDTQYPTVGSLLEEEFLPYFDIKRPGATAGWSHWLSPEYIGDDTLVDPDRPESILVDNESWRPIGVMFIATVDGDPVDPPTLYAASASDNGDSIDDGANGDSSHEGADDGSSHSETDHAETDHEGTGDENRCSPWHYHRGLPGRLAWAYYRQVHERDYEEGELSVPCRTPCMMHVWTVPHPEGVFAHDAPPPEYRGGPPVADPGFETDADPDEEPLGWDALPDDAVPDRKPRDLLTSW